MGVPQLRMVRPTLEDLPSAILPDGYSWRTFHSGDEAAWIDLLHTGDFGTWDAARLAKLLAGERAPLPPECVVFLTQNDVPIGVAGAFLHPDGVELGWVVIHPKHRGRGLCRPLCVLTLEAGRRAGGVKAFLKTEDYRPAAIRTYIGLGFTPEMTAPAHPAWWKAYQEIVIEQSSPALIFRPLSESDLDELLFSPRSRPHGANRLSKQQLGEHYVGIVEANGQPLGRCGLDFTRNADTQDAFLYAAHIEPAFQSLGIGSALIAHLEDVAQKRGITSVRLLVTKDNPRAQRLYERLGYCVIGEAINRWSYIDHSATIDVAEDCWELRKSL